MILELSASRITSAKSAASSSFLKTARIPDVIGFGFRPESSSFLLMKDFGDGALGDQGGDGVDVGSKGTVRGDFWRDCADGLISTFCEGAGLQRGERVNPLAGAEQFDGKNVAQVLQHAFQAARAAHAHADVVFLIA